MKNLVINVIAAATLTAGWGNVSSGKSTAVTFIIYLGVVALVRFFLFRYAAFYRNHISSQSAPGACRVPQSQWKKRPTAPWLWQGSTEIQQPPEEYRAGYRENLNFDFHFSWSGRRSRFDDWAQQTSYWQTGA